MQLRRLGSEAGDFDADLGILQGPLGLGDLVVDRVECAGVLDVVRPDMVRDGVDGIIVLIRLVQS